MNILRLAPLMVLALLGFVSPAAAATDDRSFTITPYIWLPSLDGDFRFDAPTGGASQVDITKGPTDYLENLNATLMVEGEARFSWFGVYTDVIFFDFSKDSSVVRQVNGPRSIQFPIDTGTQADFSAVLWTLAGGFDIIDDDNLRLQAFAGARYVNAEANADFRLSGPLNILPQSGSITAETDLVDGIIGVRGENRTGDWYFPYLFDVGAGSSELTWQASVGAGYRFGWGDLWLKYRYLSYEQGEDDLIQNLTFSGPALGATFGF